ncbi:MAG TPA: D-alanyl-D-alanine carboxypeptidase family protein, partial [Caldimonas sp.]
PVQVAFHHEPRAGLLFDLDTGRVLWAREATRVLPIASLAKMMTALLVVRERPSDAQVPITRNAVDAQGSKIGLLPLHKRVPLQTLLYGLLLPSGNDAAVALAEAVGGSVDVFVGMMNRQAQAWGLKNTSFKNVTGLTEPGHRSTARDMGVIAAHIISDFPEYFPYYSIKEYKYNNIAQPNRNLLLRRDPTVDGMKTGFTESAGYCLLATAQREFPNLGATGGAGKRRIMTVVLNTVSMEARANESQKLLNWGFQAFDTVRLFDNGKAIVTPQVWKGTANVAKLGASGALFVSVPRGEGARLQTKVERSDPLVAPLAKGQRVGRILVSTAAGTPLADVPLVVMEPVEQSGIFGRAWDAIRLWVK